MIDLINLYIMLLYFLKENNIIFLIRLSKIIKILDLNFFMNILIYEDKIKINKINY